jgi:hypothetical protein
MLIHCTNTFALMAMPRCGHTNMYNYFGKVIYGATGFAVEDWRKHHNSIVVLRNPLDRVVSAMLHDASLFGEGRREEYFTNHSYPYMDNILVGCDFRIIDFYDLAKYIPRQGIQSDRTYSAVGVNISAEDVYIMNKSYSLQKLQDEYEIYNNFMVNKERVTVDEWKELT